VLEANGQVVLRYRHNPNGSVADVAGICNAAGNVLGLMPHPERACDPATGGIDGQRLLAALLG
jgi:phosphoribosylformylglycinamidine synthase